MVLIKFLVFKFCPPVGFSVIFTHHNLLDRLLCKKICDFSHFFMLYDFYVTQLALRTSDQALSLQVHLEFELHLVLSFWELCLTECP